MYISLNVLLMSWTTNDIGVSYAEWKKGAKPKPIYDLHCPIQHYEQGTDAGEYIKDKRCSMKGGWKFGESSFDCAKRNKDSCWVWIANNKIPKD